MSITKAEIEEIRKWAVKCALAFESYDRIVRLCDFAIRAGKAMAVVVEAEAAVNAKIAANESFHLGHVENGIAALSALVAEYREECPVRIVGRTTPVTEAEIATLRTQLAEIEKELDKPPSDEFWHTRFMGLSSAIAEYRG